jgi:hypothetical protein
LSFNIDDSQEYIHDLKARKAGKARHIITTVEQLFKTPEGHLPCLAILVRNLQFQKRIKSVTVDEAQFIPHKTDSMGSEPIFHDGRASFAFPEQLEKIFKFIRVIERGMI